MNPRILRFAAQLSIMAIIISVILLLVGIGFLVLLHICIIGRASRTDDRGTTAGRSTINGSSRSISKDDLEKLPCYDYTAEGNKSSPAECAVCLESLEIGDKCRLLPLCKHSFHAQCVDIWLLKTPICPICRTMASSSFEKGGLVVVGVNGHFGAQDIELGERQISENRGSQLMESTESGRSTDVNIGRGENAILGGPNSGHRDRES